MIIKETREFLAEVCPDAALLDNQSYDKSIIGYSDDDRVIYDYDTMVEELMEEEGWTYEEAMEWVDYNTVRAIPYIDSCTDGHAPIILHRIEV